MKAFGGRHEIALGKFRDRLVGTENEFGGCALFRVIVAVDDRGSRLESLVPCIRQLECGKSPSFILRRFPFGAT
jgi:hypothetical protein